jgi:hypothetical protein
MNMLTGNTVCGCKSRMAVRDEGFALVEVLVSAALSIGLFGLVLALLSGQVSMARVQPEAVDLQQRSRVTADILFAELTSAGAWGDHGGGSRGLVCCVPVVHPRRIGTRLADPIGVAKEDVLTMVRVAPGARAGRLRDPLPGALALQNAEGCTASHPLCGLQKDDHVIVFEESGDHDFFVLGPPAADSAPLTLRQAALASAFQPGAIAVGVETRTFYFERASRQLRLYDGHLSDMPIVDDVAGVRFEYWGAPGVPARTRAESGTATCWFDQGGQPRFGRAVAVPGAPNVRLTLAEFRDGPWCGAGDNRFDADLLRVRHVRAIVRLSATGEMARGVGSDFLVPGRAVSPLRLVPDMEVVVDVAPRNLNGDY